MLHFYCLLNRFHAFLLKWCLCITFISINFCFKISFLSNSFFFSSFSIAFLFISSSTNDFYSLVTVLLIVFLVTFPLSVCIDHISSSPLLNTLPMSLCCSYHFLQIFLFSMAQNWFYYIYVLLRLVEVLPQVVKQVFIIFRIY